MKTTYKFPFCHTWHKNCSVGGVNGKTIGYGEKIMKDKIINMVGIMLIAVIVMAAASKTSAHGTVAAQSAGNPTLLAAAR